MESEQSERLVDKDFQKWSPVQVAEYLGKKEGLDSYAQLFQQHKVDGSVVHTLTDGDLKEMGIEAIGDRKKVLSAIKGLREASAQLDREKILWEGTEERYWSCCHWARSTCCGCSTNDAEKYTLRYNFLEIYRPDYKKVGSIRCCCGHSFLNLTVDLSNISNVELEGVPPPCMDQCCCCAKEHEHVIVNLSTPENGREILRLKKGDGAAMKRKLKNQVEIMQRMERS